MAQCINIHRLRWLDHVVRMEQMQNAKYAKIRGNRQIGWKLFNSLVSATERNVREVKAFGRKDEIRHMSC